MAFPNVPDVPGVPALPRAPGAPSGPPPQLTSDAPSVASLQPSPGPQWGIFDQDGTPVLVGDSVVAFEYLKEYRVSNYPVEQGGFASYNKVELPFDARLEFAQGGSDADRQAFLDAAAEAQRSLSLFTVVTPELYYPSATIVHIDYRRRATKGVTLLSVDVWVEQVRVTGSAQFSKTKSPSGADPIDEGTVQPVGTVNLGTPTFQ